MYYSRFPLTKVLLIFLVYTPHTYHDCLFRELSSATLHKLDKVLRVTIGYVHTDVLDVWDTV